jgi:hypothetical protein
MIDRSAEARALVARLRELARNDYLTVDESKDLLTAADLVSLLLPARRDVQAALKRLSDSTRTLESAVGAPRPAGKE